MADIAKLVEELSQLTVLEAADLAKALEEAWGVSAAAAVAVAAPAGGGAAAAEVEDQPALRAGVVAAPAGGQGRRNRFLQKFNLRKASEPCGF